MPMTGTTRQMPRPQAPRRTGDGRHGRKPGTARMSPVRGGGVLRDISGRAARVPA